jgi:hypothetical protein
VVKIDYLKNKFIKIMPKEIQLPDYLPSRYKSWLHLYLEVQQAFAERGESFDEETTINMCELGDREEREMLINQFGEEVVLYQHFPVTLIKARAFDFILSKLPTFKELINIRSAAMGADWCTNESMWEVFNNLLKLYPAQLP